MGQKAIIKNSLFYGDNLEMMRKCIGDETIELCYIDPPFNSKRSYNQIYNNLGAEDKAQAQAFIDTWTWDTEAMEGFEAITHNQHGLYTKQSIELIIGLSKVLGKGNLLAYLVSMTQRIAEIWRVLKPTGSFYLHCDSTASHYLKLILDGLFCSREGDFRNEIIWKRSAGFKRGTAKKFPQKNDVILFYTKSHNFEFHTQYNPHKPEYISRFKPDESGRLARSDVNPTKGGRRKIYLDNTPGDIIDSVWVDIPPINPVAHERLGYPTQKPEALLERIIKASSNEGDTILDCYCGCGTTVAVAQRLNRRWIGIDITYQAISVILKRLGESFGDDFIKTIDLTGQPKDIEGARALANKKDDRLRKEFEKWAILTYSNNLAIVNEKKGADKGIDGTAFIQATHTDYKQIIFSVKSGQNINVTMVRDLRGVIEREDAAMGILITLEEPTAPMIQEARAAGSYQSELSHQKFNRLQIVTIQEILNGERLNVPLTHDVLKRAKAQSSNPQLELSDPRVEIALQPIGSNYRTRWV